MSNDIWFVNMSRPNLYNVQNWNEGQNIWDKQIITNALTNLIAS
jgi:hypothetical protein